MKTKFIKGKGRHDYDYAYDILYFRIKNREYDHSVELEDIVIDVDKQGSIIGIQIFDASTFFAMQKKSLLKIQKWECKSIVNNGRIEIRLQFQVMERNKIIEKNPIIIEALTQPLPNSEMTCEV